jgi:N-acetylmuramic acid 6-phosphate etherase
MFHDSKGMESPKRILGLEGGGTKTDWVLLAGDGAVLREGVLPASNLRLITDEELGQLLSVLPQEATHVGAFLAGCAVDEDRARLRALVAKVWPKAQIAIGSDRDSGLATAFHDGDGIAVISGTGTAVHGRRDGRIEKAGGWGQLLGDRGGGYDLARRGLRLVLTDFDLNQKITPLAEEILQILGLNRLQDLVGWAMQADKMSVARLAPAIFHAARMGEPQMLTTVQAGADILAQFTHAVADRLDFPAAPVRLIGGLFTHNEEYVALYKYRLSALLPKATVEVCAESGALGAAWLAARAVNPPLPTETVVVSDAEALATATTEQSNPRSVSLEERTTGELVDLFVTEESKVAEALAACRAELIEAVDLVSTAMQAGGRLFYVGAGTSGRLGVLDASEIPPTFGAPPELVQGIIAGGAMALHRAVEGAEDQPEAGALAILERGVRANDVVCGISASGRAPFVLGALQRGCDLGAHTILLTCNPARKATDWDVEIDLPTGPEIVTGSTRLKAGTATKVVLNILSTCTMVRLGRVRGNAMVDLRISNAKLRDRGVRLVSRELRISYKEARERLEKAGWNVRAALH